MVVVLWPISPIMRSCATIAFASRTTYAKGEGGFERGDGSNGCSKRELRRKGERLCLFSLLLPFPWTETKTKDPPGEKRKVPGLDL